MRSTMTEYFGSSVIFVPPHFTISPLIPCRAPFSLTLAMNAGGKLYSRPTRRPTGLGALDIGFIFFVPCCSVLFRGLAGFAATIDARARFSDDVTDDRLQVPGIAEHRELLIRAGAFAQDRVHVLNGLAAPQFVDHIVDKLQQLQREQAHRHLRTFAEIDQLSVNAP